MSYYVAPKSLLDETAFSRGTSVYYADSVIPMLPPALSNGACSLNPREDRFAFSALVSLDQEGEIQKFRFEKSVIRSRVKGVYSEINRIFQGERDEALLDKYRRCQTSCPSCGNSPEFSRPGAKNAERSTSPRRRQRFLLTKRDAPPISSRVCRANRSA